MTFILSVSKYQSVYTDLTSYLSIRSIFEDYSKPGLDDSLFTTFIYAFVIGIVVWNREAFWNGKITCTLFKFFFFNLKYNPVK